MRKKFVIIFSAIVFFIASFVGCSSDSIRKVEIIDDIKTNYIVNENVEMSNFSLKVTFKNGTYKIYNIDDEMIEISNIDNTIVGSQNVNIRVNYNGMEIDFIVSVNFDKPSDVKTVISLIDELPEIENIDLTIENKINLISDSYFSLDNSYKRYVTNYAKFILIREQFDRLKAKYITAQLINDRFVLKTNLDNLVNSLNSNEYSEDQWAIIMKIYNDSIIELYKNENYSKISEIVSAAIEEINSIHTESEKFFLIAKEYKKASLLEYKNNLLLNAYSKDNTFKIETMVEDFVASINSLETIEEVENLYNMAISLLDSIQTIEQEIELDLSNLKESKIIVAKDILLSYDLSKYSLINRDNIVGNYNSTISNIRECLDEESMDRVIALFKYNLSKVKTLDQESIELLEATKKQLLIELNEFYNEIDIYEYDSANRKVIEISFINVVEEINNSKSIKEINDIKNNIVAYIDSIPTLYEQAINNLPNKINQAKDLLLDYLSQLNSSDYNSQNWAIIESLNYEYKLYFQENITIYTSNIEINSKIEEFKERVNNVLTIKEENEIKLQEAKNSAIDSLNYYYKNLDENDFYPKVFAVVKEKISENIQLVKRLDSIAKITKLVDDTIKVIQDAKIK